MVLKEVGTKNNYWSLSTIELRILTVKKKYLDDDHEFIMTLNTSPRTPRSLNTTGKLMTSMTQNCCLRTWKFPYPNHLSDSAWRTFCNLESKAADFCTLFWRLVKWLKTWHENCCSCLTSKRSKVFWHKCRGTLSDTSTEILWYLKSSSIFKIEALQVSAKITRNQTLIVPILSITFDAAPGLLVHVFSRVGAQLSRLKFGEAGSKRAGVRRFSAQ